MRIFKDTEDHLWVELPKSHPADTEELLVAVGEVELHAIIRSMQVEPQHIDVIQSSYGPLALVTDVEP
jgi:hypothetical protein